MTDTTHGLPLVQRVVAEHRTAVYGLLAALAVNLVVFVFLVRPLENQVATVEQRTRTAEGALDAARAEHARISDTLTGKDRARKGLDTFYTTVLAPDLPAARRLTYSRLALLAEDADLAYARGSYAPEVERGSSLTRLKVTMDLVGSYRNVRDFIHAIETERDFLVIDSVTMAAVAASDGEIRLTLGLSTYYRTVTP